MPVILIHGRRDEVAPPATSRILARRMQAMGMKYRFFEIPQGDHIDVIAWNPQNIRRIFDFFDESGRPAPAGSAP
jgi:dipeptidyl aminopeptidase/acylaminoacyl peptidase